MQFEIFPAIYNMIYHTVVVRTRVSVKWHNVVLQIVYTYIRL
jgi:hypothetical protein